MNPCSLKYSKSYLIFQFLLRPLKPRILLWESAQVCSRVLVVPWAHYAQHVSRRNEGDIFRYTCWGPGLQFRDIEASHLLVSVLSLEIPCFRIFPLFAMASAILHRTFSPHFPFTSFLQFPPICSLQCTFYTPFCDFLDLMFSRFFYHIL